MFSRFHRARPGAKTCESDRKSTRLNSSHSQISYAVFCLKKKKHTLRELHAEALRTALVLLDASTLPHRPLLAPAEHDRLDHLVTASGVLLNTLQQLRDAH